jgi:LuxR family maltose regulon positive regulatory protein
MYVGLSQIACERNDLAAAGRYLSQSLQLGESSGLPQNPYRWRVTMARLRELQGDLDGALHLLDEAQRVYVGDFSPDVRPIRALRVRLLAANGRPDDAGAEARGLGVSVDDEPSYLREFAHITLARVLLARGELDAALTLLHRLRTAAEQGGRTGSLIEILVLQALVLQAPVVQAPVVQAPVVRALAPGDTAAALVPLEQALVLAEPHRHVRVFVDAGAPMIALLTAVSRTRKPATYIHHLLSAAGAASRVAASPAGTIPGLVDPLSERELDVLRLLATDLDGPDIARRLSVSLNTVRTHTKNIYAKLGVNNRRAAVRQAGQLDLL